LAATRRRSHTVQRPERLRPDRSDGRQRTEDIAERERAEVGPASVKEDTVAKEDRGFASMDPAKQREIASKGGKAAHQKGTAHEWTSEEARDAGRKGGIASHRRRREQTGGPDDTDAGNNGGMNSDTAGGQ